MGIIDIRVHRSENRLFLPEQIDLHEGDLVDWNFEGLLNIQELAFIYFNSPADQVFGPFQFLEPSSFHVRGLGNNGNSGTYHYTAFILKTDGVVAQSDGMARVVNHSSRVDTSPFARVFCVGEQIFTEPKHLLVEHRRSALWYIQDLPPGYFVTFDFVSCPDVMIGPFSSFSMNQGFGQAQVAIGNNFAGEDNQQFPYIVSLRRPDGSVASKTDPVIEPPPGWPPSSQGGAAG